MMLLILSMPTYYSVYFVYLSRKDFISIVSTGRSQSFSQQTQMSPA